MILSIAEFEKGWGHESGSTLKLMRVLTDASLEQAVGPQDRTLGRIAWHIATSIGEMMGRTGLALDGPSPDAPVARTAAEIVAAYEQASTSLLRQMKAKWTDESLKIEDDMYGMKWNRATTLAILIAHETHHRGQMTVLMRQAGLVVPGVYGPAREEWAAMGAPIPEV